MKKKKNETKGPERPDMAARVIQTWTAARRTRYPRMSKLAREKGKKNGRQ